MTILEISQVIFNFVISAVAIVIAISIGLIAYDTVRLAKSIKKFTDSIGKGSSELYDKISKLFESIFNVSSFVSRLLKKKKKTK